MCNRYELHYRLDAEYQALLQVGWQLEFSSYNNRPTSTVPIVRSVDGRRELAKVRWGLIPFFAKGIPGKFLMSNARVETVATSPAYRGPWKRGQRCLQLASGFYESHQFPEGRKGPFYIHLVDQPIFAFASMWDRSVIDDGEAMESCTIVTMAANELMHDIHNVGDNPHRMPAILRHEDWEAWLTGTVDEAKEALQPYPAGLMVAHEVSGRVWKPKTDDAELIEPI